MAFSAAHHLSCLRDGAQESSVFREILQGIAGPLLDASGAEEPLPTLFTPFGTLPCEHPRTNIASRPRIITGRPPRDGKAARGIADGDEAYCGGSKNPFDPH